MLSNLSKFVIFSVSAIIIGMFAEAGKDLYLLAKQVNFDVPRTFFVDLLSSNNFPIIFSAFLSTLYFTIFSMKDIIVYCQRSKDFSQISMVFLLIEKNILAQNVLFIFLIIVFKFAGYAINAPEIYRYILIDILVLFNFAYRLSVSRLSELKK